MRTTDAKPELRAFAPDSKCLVIGLSGPDFYMWRNMNNPLKRMWATFLPTASAL